MQMQNFLAIYLYYGKISRDKIKNPSIFRISSQQILKYIIINSFKKQVIAIGFIIAIIVANAFTKL